MSVYQHVNIELRGCEVLAVVHRSPNVTGVLNDVYYCGIPSYKEYPLCAYEPDRCRHDRHTVNDLTEVEKEKILDAAAEAWDAYWNCDDVRQARDWRRACDNEGADKP